jgi:hypothetical protein
MKAYGPWVEKDTDWYRYPLWEDKEDDANMEFALIAIYSNLNGIEWGTYGFKENAFNFHWFNSIEEAKKVADHLLIHRGFKLINSSVYSLR